MKAIVRIKQIALLLITIGFYIFTSCSEKKEELPIINDGVTATLTFEDGSTVDYVGAVVMNAIWSQENGINQLAIIATDRNYKNAVFSFGISHANGAGSYSLDPNERMANPAKLMWDDMEFDNWIGFVTGDANGDGQSDGSGWFIIDTLSENETKGTFSMVMGNDLGEKLTVKGAFNLPVRRIIES